MDRLLKLLADYQSFAQNEHLGELIAETEEKYSSGIVRLDFDELDISAAGDAYYKSSDDDK